MMRVLLLLSLVAGICFPASGQTSSKSVSEGTAWPHVAYDKVIGYHFENPNHSTFVAEAVTASTVAGLSKVKTQEVTLDDKQAKELLAATFDAAKPVSLAFCYDPHHVFVFYAKDTPVAAIEVCFHCITVQCWPKDELVHHNDFVKLNGLCQALGFKEHVTYQPEAKEQPLKNIAVPPGLR